MEPTILTVVNIKVNVGKSNSSRQRLEEKREMLPSPDKNILVNGLNVTKVRTPSSCRVNVKNL